MTSTLPFEVIIAGMTLLITSSWDEAYEKMISTPGSRITFSY